VNANVTARRRSEDSRHLDRDCIALAAAAVAVRPAVTRPSSANCSRPWSGKFEPVAKAAVVTKRRPPWWAGRSRGPEIERQMVGPAEFTRVMQLTSDNGKTPGLTRPSGYHTPATRTKDKGRQPTFEILAWLPRCALGHLHVLFLFWLARIASSPTASSPLLGTRVMPPYAHLCLVTCSS
jgi:hypothetical protein